MGDFLLRVEGRFLTKGGGVQYRDVTTTVLYKMSATIYANYLHLVILRYLW